MENRLKIGIAHGDINGISYELILKMLSENKLNEVCVPVLYGSSKVAAFYRKAFDAENLNLNLNLNFNSIQKPGEANEKRSNIINCVDDEVKVDVGKETEESNQIAIKALNHALEDLDNDRLPALVIAPQSESAYSKDGKKYIEYFASRYRAINVMQVLVGSKMKIGFVTTQTPFNEVAQHITVENVFKKLQLLDHCLREDFTIRKPRIAVLALNPNTGAQGFYGTEEKEIILPAIEKARSRGIVALGPYPADSLFAGTDYEKFDAILALHDEQGMVPFKTIEGYSGAMYLAGLSKIIALTVNGPAYDIAGKGIADESGLRNAVYLGIDIYNNRMLYKEITRNPLPHYDVAGNANESEMNVEQIAGLKADF